MHIDGNLLTLNDYDASAANIGAPNGFNPGNLMNESDNSFVSMRQKFVCHILLLITFFQPLCQTSYKTAFEDTIAGKLWSLVAGKKDSPPASTVDKKQNRNVNLPQHMNPAVREPGNAQSFDPRPKINVSSPFTKRSGNRLPVPHLEYISMAWTLLDGGDHDGEDWIITENTDVGGIHTNINRFVIQNGVTVTAKSDFTVYASDAITDGKIKHKGGVKSKIHTTDAPVLVSPPNGTAINLGQTQTFTFETSGTNKTYNYQVATDPAFTTLFAAGSITTNSFSLNMSQPGQFFWRVNWTKGGQTSPYSVTWKLTVNPPTNLVAVAGQFYSTQISSGGVQNPTSFTIVSGSIPQGLSLASSSGTLSGHPLQTGEFQFTVKISGAASQAFLVYTLQVVDPLKFIIDIIPAGTQGTSYSAQIQVSGGIAPYSFAISAGTLPAGISLAGNTLSGTPTQYGDFAFTVNVSDSTAAVISKSFLLSVAKQQGGAAPAATFTFSPSQNALVANKSPELSATVSPSLDNFDLSTLLLTVDEIPYKPLSIDTAANKITVKPAYLSEGQHAFKIALGNSTGLLSFKVDTTAPDVSTVPAPGAKVKALNPAVTVIYTDESGIANSQIFFNGLEITGLPFVVLQPSALTFFAQKTGLLTEGINTVKFIAADSAGNTVERITTFSWVKTPDVAEPFLQRIAPMYSSQAVGAPLTAFYVAEDESGVAEFSLYKNGQLVSTLLQGPFQFELSVDEGLNSFSAVAKDTAGNAATESFDIYGYVPPEEGVAYFGLGVSDSVVAGQQFEMTITPYSSTGVPMDYQGDLNVFFDDVPLLITFDGQPVQITALTKSQYRAIEVVSPAGAVGRKVVHIIPAAPVTIKIDILDDMIGQSIRQAKIGVRDTFGNPVNALAQLKITYEPSGQIYSTSIQIDGDVIIPLYTGGNSATISVQVNPSASSSVSLKPKLKIDAIPEFEIYEAGESVSFSVYVMDGKGFIKEDFEGQVKVRLQRRPLFGPIILDALDVPEVVGTFIVELKKEDGGKKFVKTPVTLTKEGVHYVITDIVGEEQILPPHEFTGDRIFYVVPNYNAAQAQVSPGYGGGGFQQQVYVKLVDMYGNSLGRVNTKFKVKISGPYVNQEYIVETDPFGNGTFYIPSMPDWQLQEHTFTVYWTDVNGVEQEIASVQGNVGTINAQSKNDSYLGVTEVKPFFVGDTLDVEVTLNLKEKLSAWGGSSGQNAPIFINFPTGGARSVTANIMDTRFLKLIHAEITTELSVTASLTGQRYPYHYETDSDGNSYIVCDPAVADNGSASNTYKVTDDTKFESDTGVSFYFKPVDETVNIGSHAPSCSVWLSGTFMLQGSVTVKMQFKAAVGNPRVFDSLINGDLYVQSFQTEEVVNNGETSYVSYIDYEKVAALEGMKLPLIVQPEDEEDIEIVPRNAFQVMVYAKDESSQQATLGLKRYKPGGTESIDSEPIKIPVYNVAGRIHMSENIVFLSSQNVPRWLHTNSKDSLIITPGIPANADGVSKVPAVISVHDKAGKVLSAVKIIVETSEVEVKLSAEGMEPATSLNLETDSQGSAAFFTTSQKAGTKSVTVKIDPTWLQQNSDVILQGDTQKTIRPYYVLGHIIEVEPEYQVEFVLSNPGFFSDSSKPFTVTAPKADVIDIVFKYEVQGDSTQRELKNAVVKGIPSAIVLDMKSVFNVSRRSLQYPPDGGPPQEDPSSKKNAGAALYHNDGYYETAGLEKAIFIRNIPGYLFGFKNIQLYTDQGKLLEMVEGEGPADQYLKVDETAGTVTLFVNETTDGHFNKGLNQLRAFSKFIHKKYHLDGDPGDVSKQIKFLIYTSDDAYVAPYESASDTNTTASDNQNSPVFRNRITVEFDPQMQNADFVLSDLMRKYGLIPLGIWKNQGILVAYTPKYVSQSELDAIKAQLQQELQALSPESLAAVQQTLQFPFRANIRVKEGEEFFQRASLYETTEGTTPFDGYADSVNLHNGEFLWNQNLMSVSSVWQDFDFTATYRSQVDYAGHLGRNWDSNYPMILGEYESLPGNDNGDVAIFSAGKRVFFEWNQDFGKYTAPAGVYMKLEKKISGGTTKFILRGSDTITKYVFELPGTTSKIFPTKDPNPVENLLTTNQGKTFERVAYLTKIIEDSNDNDTNDGSENAMLFKYNTDDTLNPSIYFRLTEIDDTVGRVYHLKYNEKGFLVKLDTAIGGPQINLYYDASDDLIRIERKTSALSSYSPSIETTTFVYYTLGSQAHLLKAIITPNQNKDGATYDLNKAIVENTYGQADLGFRRVILQRAGLVGGENTASYQFIYKQENGKVETEVIDKNTDKTTWEFHGAPAYQYRGKMIQPDYEFARSATAVKETILDNGQQFVYEFQYDKDCKVTSTKSPKGVIRSSTYVDGDDPENGSDGLTRGNLLQSGVSGWGIVEAMQYDQWNNVKKKTTARGIASGNEAVYTTEYVFNANRLEKVIVPEVVLGSPQSQRTVTYQYHPNGLVKSSSNVAAGTLEEYTYDSRGYLLERKVSKGAENFTFKAQFDDIGRQQFSIDHRGVKTQFETDDFFNNVKTIYATGANTEYSETAYRDHEGNVVQRVISGQGASIVDSYEYDEYGQLIKSTQPGGIVTEIKYDKMYRQVQSTVQGSGILPTIQQYNARGLLISSTQGVLSSTYKYDSDGQLEEATEHGLITKYERNAVGMPTKIILPTGVVITRGYDKAGNVREEFISGPGMVFSTYKRHFFDNLNRHYATVADFNPTTTQSGNPNSAQLGSSGLELGSDDYAYQQTIAGRPVAVSYSYDNSDRIFKLIDDTGKTISAEFDVLGRVVKQTTPEATVEINHQPFTTTITQTINGFTTTTVVTLDALGREISTQSAGQQKTTQYEKLGLVVTEEDSNSNKIEYVSDLPTRTKTTKKHEGTNYSSIIEEYTVAGLISSRHVSNNTGENANSQSFQYDSYGLMTQITAGDGTVREFTYDTADKKLVKITNTHPQNGSSVVDVTGFDQFKRPKEFIFAGSNKYSVRRTVDYDGLGRPVSMTEYNRYSTPNQIPVSAATSYDSLGNVLNENQNGLEVSYNRDGLSRIVSMTYPLLNRTVNKSFDVQGRTKTLSWKGSTIGTFDYAKAAGVDQFVITLTTPEFKRTKSFDTLSRPVSVKYEKGSLKYEQTIAEYDLTSNIKQMQTDDTFAGLVPGSQVNHITRSDTYSYDAAYRLKTSSTASTAYQTNGTVNETSQSMYRDFDWRGNPTQTIFQTSGQAITKNSSNDDMNRCNAMTIQLSGGSSYKQEMKYDDQGNLTEKLFSYTQQGAGTEVIGAQKYEWDALGRLATVRENARFHTKADGISLTILQVKKAENDPFIYVTAQVRDHSGYILKAYKGGIMDLYFGSTGKKLAFTITDTFYNRFMAGGNDSNGTVSLSLFNDSVGTQIALSDEFDSANDDFGKAVAKAMVDVFLMYSARFAGDAVPLSSYFYDSYGRRVYKVIGSVTGEETVEERINQFSTASSGVDINGTHRFVYSGDTLVQEQSPGNNIVSYIYENESSKELLAEEVHPNGYAASAGLMTYFVYGFGGTADYRIVNGQVKAPAKTDFLGNTLFDISEPSGHVLWQGHYYDSETGFYFAGARYYDPITARFISVDPIGAYSDLVNFGNGYLYGGNNPLSFTDASGRFAIPQWLKDFGAGAWEGVKVVAGVVIGVLVVALIIAAAMFIPGAAYVLIGLLIYSAISSGINRWEQTGSVGLTALGILSDVSGFTDIWAGATNRDIITGKYLGMDSFERGFRFGMGAASLVALGYGAVKFFSARKPGAPVEPRPVEPQTKSNVSRATNESMNGGRPANPGVDKDVAEVTRLINGMKEDGFNFSSSEYTGPAASERPIDVAARTREASRPLDNPAGRTVGRSPAQNGFVRRFVQKLIDLGAEDIRVNQRQTDPAGEFFRGINRPDVQFTIRGRRFYLELDTPSSGRGLPHGGRIRANDGSGIIFLIKMK